MPTEDMKIAKPPEHLLTDIWWICDQVKSSQIAYGDNGFVRLDLTTLDEKTYTKDEIIEKSGLTVEELALVDIADLVEIMVNQQGVWLTDRCMETVVLQAIYSLWANLNESKQEAVRLVVLYQCPPRLSFLEWATVVAQADKIYYVPYAAQ